MKKNAPDLLPDIALNQKSTHEGMINRVGMSQIEIPIVVESNGEKFRAPARASAYVSLDRGETKGIHMSRLFSRLQTLAEKEISSDLLEEIVKSFQESHQEMSQSSELSLAFDFMLKRESLLSKMTGWRHYPVELKVNYENNSDKKQSLSWTLSYQVVYSSTCPCSAALARQLIQEKFNKEFSSKELKREEIHEWLAREEAICATPHSQRSVAHVKLVLKEKPENLVSSVQTFIEETEAKLGTPVQSFVKRIDEQEFARLSGENLMFCEDAARRIQNYLVGQSMVSSYSIEVEHQESLHPHNAVAKIWGSL